MKPFDLEAAKAGAPVCTRDGRKARIICFDRKFERYPIIALIDNSNAEEETVISYANDGLYLGVQTSNYDLFMASQKREGWINIYPMIDKKAIAETGHHIYKTKELAKFHAMQNVIATVKIEWEE